MNKLFEVAFWVTGILFLFGGAKTGAFQIAFMVTAFLFLFED